MFLCDEMLNLDYKYNSISQLMFFILLRNKFSSCRYIFPIQKINNFTDMLVFIAILDCSMLQNMLHWNRDTLISLELLSLNVTIYSTSCVRLPHLLVYFSIFINDYYK